MSTRPRTRESSPNRLAYPGRAVMGSAPRSAGAPCTDRAARFGVSILLLFGTAAVTSAQLPTVTDIGLESKFQDGWFGHFKRGRACVAADFDLDGDIDFYIGNPGDESFVMRHAGEGPQGTIVFELVQVLLTGELAFGAAAADYDNDGDYDIFITGGGIEGSGECFLFRNLVMETGELSFEDVTDQAGVRGAVPPGEDLPIPAAHNNAVWGDYNRDANVDIFVSVYIHDESLPELLGRNILWHNNGDGTFTDVTDDVGLGSTARTTRNSTFFDMDNDGDLDLYENSFNDANVLWQNQLLETGKAEFLDVTEAFSPPGEDLSYPLYSVATAAGDFNNDGWQDIIAFVKNEVEDGPYDQGHAIFINQEGTGFVNVAPQTGINDAFQVVAGVMGCQLGDLNGDGVLDVFFGNGGWSGEFNLLLVSDAQSSPPGTVPTFVNIGEAIDFPAPEDPGMGYPPYPYRTHGTACVDTDGDGTLELAVGNGGPAAMPDTVREPNRLFEFDWGRPINYFKVRPVGDGVNVSRDAIGTRVAVTVSEGGGEPWPLYNTLFAGSAFSAQNGFELYFGLAGADTIHALTVTWPNGTVETRTEDLAVNTSIVVNYAPPPCEGDANGDNTVDPLDAGFVLSRLGCKVGTGDPNCDAADQNGDETVDPLDVGFVLARFGPCP